MNTTPETLAIRARQLRTAGFSYREIARKVGVSKSVAHRLARNVPIINRRGKGWPDRHGWPIERPVNYACAGVHRLYGIPP